MAAPRHSMWRVVSAPLVKRLSRLGYEIVPKGAMSTGAVGKESAGITPEVDEDQVLTQDMLDQALAIAEGTAKGFESRLKDEDEEAVVEALGRYFVLGEVPEGMAIEPEPTAESGAEEPTDEAKAGERKQRRRARRSARKPA